MEAPSRHCHLQSHNGGKEEPVLIVGPDLQRDLKVPGEFLLVQLHRDVALGLAAELRGEEAVERVGPRARPLLPLNKYKMLWNFHLRAKSGEPPGPARNFATCARNRRFC